MTTLYLDMDGVVADWIVGAADIIGYRLPDANGMYPDADWNKIRDEKHMYMNLPKTELADALVILARQFRDVLGWELMFLTAIPHNNDMPWAFYDKVMWANNYYPDIPVMFGPYSRDKWQHCQPGDILVDDRPDNCQAWINAGGRSVFVEPSGDVTQAISELAQILANEREARQR